MDPISAIAMSLALGAGAIAGKELVSAAVKDAYSALKGLLKSRYPKVSVEHLEQAPASKARRAGVEEELTEVKAEHDSEVLVAARHLLDMIRQHEPAAAVAIGVDIRDVSAASIKLNDIQSSGTGAKIEKATVTGAIDIGNVRAGIQPNAPAKSG
jgi:hypothetical protein